MDCTFAVAIGEPQESGFRLDGRMVVSRRGRKGLGSNDR